MKVAVGSTNPTKVGAVREAFSEAFGDAVVKGIDVDPGVSKQPISPSEIVKGATNRAKRALREASADFGVGIEGGVARFGGRWYNVGFVAVVDKSGRIGTGTSGWFECSEKILNQLKSGVELGDVIEKMVGRKDTKSREGAIGIITRGAVDRKALYKHGVWMALSPFLAPEFF